MSDGLTDVHRSTLAAERQHMLLRSVSECLKDFTDEAKYTTAVNDAMAFEKWLHEPDLGVDREAAAKAYLSRLRNGIDHDWAVLLAFALRHGHGADSSFRELKKLSPFKDKTLFLALSNDTGTHLSQLTDLGNTIEFQLKGREFYAEHATKILVLDISVDAAYVVKP